MRHIVNCGLPCSTILFPHYLIKGKIFGKKNFVNHKMCVFIFFLQFYSERFLILRTERDEIKMYIGRRVK